MLQVCQINAVGRSKETEYQHFWKDASSGESWFDHVTLNELERELSKIEKRFEINKSSYSKHNTSFMWPESSYMKPVSLYTLERVLKAAAFTLPDICERSRGSCFDKVNSCLGTGRLMDSNTFEQNFTTFKRYVDNSFLSMISDVFPTHDRMMM